LVVTDFANVVATTYAAPSFTTVVATTPLKGGMGYGAGTALRRGDHEIWAESQVSATVSRYAYPADGLPTLTLGPGIFGDYGPTELAVAPCARPNC
jgi:hypothetical protein